MATATRVGELQGSLTLCLIGETIWFSIMTRFFWQNRIGVETLPRSVIAQSLAHLLETYPNGFFAQFVLFVISDELLALLSFLHLGYSSPHRILHELCRRMLCCSSLDNSSLRAGLCHLWFHRNP